MEREEEQRKVRQKEEKGKVKGRNRIKGSKKELRKRK